MPCLRRDRGWESKGWLNAACFEVCLMTMSQQEQGLSTRVDAPPNLSCPICGDVNIAFHSQIAVPLQATTEPTAVFTCSDSHTFFVPCCSLRHSADGSPRPHRQPRSSILDLHAQAEVAGFRLRGAVEDCRALTARAWELQARWRQAYAKLRMAHLTNKILLAECRKSAQLGAELSRLAEAGNAPGERPCGRAVQ